MKEKKDLGTKSLEKFFFKNTWSFSRNECCTCQRNTRTEWTIGKIDRFFMTIWKRLLENELLKKFTEFSKKVIKVG